MRHPLPLAALFAAAGAACPVDCSGEWRPDETLPCGVAVRWGPETDHALCEALEGLPAGGGVEFVSEADGLCVRRDVAGCWWEADDIAFVEARPTLTETALRHEQIHRWLWRTTGDADYGHTRPEWR